MRFEFYDGNGNLLQYHELLRVGRSVVFREYSAEGETLKERNGTASEVALVVQEEQESKQRRAGEEYNSLSAIAGKTDAQIVEYVDKLTIVDPEGKRLAKLIARSVGALARDKGFV